MISSLEDRGACSESHFSMRGYEFNIKDDAWVLDRNIKINLAHIGEFNELLSVSVREALAYYATTYSSGYVNVIVDSLRIYLMETELKEITLLGLQVLKVALSKQGEPKLAVLRTFLRGMRHLGLGYAIDNDVFELMDSWRLSGGNRGIPVLSLDPESGPFSDLEFESIGHRAASKYADGLLSIESYIVIQLFMATGRRPEQIALLKAKDLKNTDEFGFGNIYALSIPRLKQGRSKFRSELRAFGIEKTLGMLIQSHISEQASRVESMLGRKLNGDERAELPLFLNKAVLSDLALFEDDSLIDFLKTESCHVKRAWLASLLKTAVNRLDVFSERTGRRIHVNAYRFRYTLGARAAREGAGKLTIANLLDHSDIQHTDCYVRNVPEYAAEISSIMNQPLARYATAFVGRLVNDEAEANRELSGAARIPLREKECDVGSCGTNAFCQENAPVACYLCEKFRPWRDAPHELVLDWLMEERKRLRSVISDEKGRNPLVNINDRAIIAVCQVIKLCEDASL